MSTTSPANRACPQCKATIPSGAPEGLCPACLVAVNLASQTEWTEDRVTAAGMVEKKDPPSPPPAPGEIAPLFPQLEIIECLGRGGMGVVYKARQKSLERWVALKLVAPERGQDPTFAARFQREALALARLSHPNIVTIHDFGQAGPYFFLLMEFVDGVNLRQLLRARKLAPEEALAIVPALCEALQYAHDRGIVHRDIKPENLLLARDGQIKIADFGVAKLMGADTAEVQAADRSAAAQAGAGPGSSSSQSLPAAGTPAYMAPEQKSAPHRVDRRADIYSLGVVLYEMLTGERPSGPLEPPSRKVHIDVRLDQIVLRALERAPELRWQTAEELRTELVTLTDPSRSASRPSSSAPAPPRPAPASRWTRAALAGTLVLFAVMALSSTTAMLLPRSYQAKARLLPGGRPDILVSSEVLQRAVTDLNLAQRWNEPTEADLMRRLGGHIALYINRDTHSPLCDLRVTGRRPDEAEELANGLSLAACAIHPGTQIVEPADGTARLIGPNYFALITVGTVLGLLTGFFTARKYTRMSARSLELAQSDKDSESLSMDTAPRLALWLVLASIILPVVLGPFFIFALRTQHGGPFKWYQLLFFLGAVLFCIPGTRMGWRHLRATRALAAPKPQAVAALIAALTWPLIVAGVVLGVVLFNLLPRGHGPRGILCFALAMVAMSIVVVRSVVRWWTSPSGKEAAPWTRFFALRTGILEKVLALGVVAILFFTWINNPGPEVPESSELPAPATAVKDNPEPVPAAAAPAPVAQPVASSTAPVAPPIAEAASVRTTISETEQRVLQAQYEKVLSELLETEKELRLAAAGVHPAGSRTEAQLAGLEQRSRVLAEEREILRRRLETARP